MKKLKTILMGLRTNLGATQVLVDDKMKNRAEKVIEAGKKSDKLSELFRT